MAIVIFYHLSGYKCFKYFYNQGILKTYKSYFPDAVSYNRFIELKPRVNLALYLFLHLNCMGQKTGVYYIDSTKMPVCDNHRIHSHKVFKSLAKRGKTSTGWFYGLKLHLIINEKGEVMGFSFSSGNISDSNPDVVAKTCQHIDEGHVFGDAGYISQKLFDRLYEQGLLLLTKIRRNMKNKLVKLKHKYLLKKRTIVETVIDLLKNICDIWHTRHRSIDNAFNNLLAALAAYSFLDRKPAIRYPIRKYGLLQES